MPDDPVALSELGTSLPSLLLAHRALDEPLVLVVVLLELTGGVYLQVPSGLCARVAEGVVAPPRLENERAFRREHHFPSYVKGKLALQHEGALVLASVGVRGD